MLKSLEIGQRIFNNIKLSVGTSNIFNNFPDENPFAGVAGSRFRAALVTVSTICVLAMIFSKHATFGLGSGRRNALSGAWPSFEKYIKRLIV